MKTIISNEAIYRIRTFFMFAYILLFILCGIICILFIAAFFSNEIAQRFCELPIGLSIDNPGLQITLDGKSYNTVITGAFGDLQLINGPAYIAYLSLGAGLIFLFILLYTTKQIIKILDNIQDGMIFVRENAIRLRKISLMLIGMFLLDFLPNILFTYIFPGNFSGPMADDISLFGYDADLGMLFYPLFLLVMAEVFRIGTEMKEEQELTI